MGIKPGDQILSINGVDMVDVFDYDFYTTEEQLVIELQDRTLTIQKEQYEDGSDPA